MDSIAKLFKKISRKDRNTLRGLVVTLQDPKARKKLNIKKLQNSDFYRVRTGRFRIIFHIEKKCVVIDSIKLSLDLQLRPEVAKALREASEDIKKGRNIFGSFKTAKEVISYLDQ